MKWSVVLLLLAAAVTVHSQKKKLGPGFTTMKMGMKEMKSMMDDAIDDMLDDSTDSGLPQEVDQMLSQIEQSVCFNPKKTCKSDQYFGCNCIEAFQQLGRDTTKQCAKIPCYMIKFLQNDFAGFLKDFKNKVKNFKDAMRLITKRIYLPAMKTACKCSAGLADATFNCIQNYDADVVEQIGRGTYTMIVENMLDIDSMKKVMDTMLAVHCNKVGGKPCFRDFAKEMMTWGRMMEKSMAGAKEGDCKAFTRLDKLVGKYIEAIGNKDMEGVVENYYMMSKKGYCDVDCADEMANLFYSCCTVEGIDLAVEQDMVENMGNVLEKFVQALSFVAEDVDTEMFSRENLEMYFSAYNPEVLCAEEEGLQPYSEKRQQCEREEY